MRFAPVVLAALMSSPLGAAEALLCENPLFQVTAEDPALAERTCRSVTAATETLSSCGIVLDQSLEISVVDEIEDVIGPCLGLYHCEENRIEILSPGVMPYAREKQSAFVGISDEAFWDSIIVHEMTHAAYEKVNCPFSSCIATSEYASYAMQVFSLPEEERAHFGEHILLNSGPSRDAISAVMYFMAPDRFAKYAWLHFNSRPDPCGYMDLIMNGKIFFDREAI